MRETREVLMSLYFHAIPREEKTKNVLCHALISNTIPPFLVTNTIISAVAFSGALKGTLTGIRQREGQFKIAVVRF